MAVGLCSGFAKDSSDPTVAETWEIKLAREAAFPRYLLEMGIGERSIEGAEAGREKDKNRILNLLCNVEGKKLRGEPPSSDHPAYKHANELLQGYLASMILPSVLLSSDVVFRSRVLEAVKTGHVRSLSLTVVPLTLEGRIEALSAISSSLPPSLEELKLIGLDGKIVPKTGDDIPVFPSLPPSFLELPELKHLSLHGADELITLPDELGTKLPKLQTLDLSGMKLLESLPDSLATLMDLQSLNLTGCMTLRRLPERLGGSFELAEAEAAAEEAAEREAEKEAARAEEAAAGLPPAEDDGSLMVEMTELPPVPGQKLSVLDLTGCEGLLVLPDLSHLEGLEVVMEGVNEALSTGWARNMRRSYNMARDATF